MHSATHGPTAVLLGMLLLCSAATGALQQERPAVVQGLPDTIPLRLLLGNSKYRNPQVRECCLACRFCAGGLHEARQLPQPQAHVWGVVPAETCISTCCDPYMGCCWGREGGAGGAHKPRGAHSRQQCSTTLCQRGQQRNVAACPRRCTCHAAAPHMLPNLPLCQPGAASPNACLTTPFLTWLAFCLLSCTPPSPRNPLSPSRTPTAGQHRQLHRLHQARQQRRAKRVCAEAAGPTPAGCHGPQQGAAGPTGRQGGAAGEWLAVCCNWGPGGLLVCVKRRQG